MRIERISENQFAIFLTFDDLVERGFTEDGLWQDVANVQELFSDMMYEAYDELGIELAGMLIVQVRLMQAQGMHIVVTQENEAVSFDEDFVEMKVTLDESSEMIFSFRSFEDVISVSEYLANIHLLAGQLYFYEEKYYMLIHDDDLFLKNKEDVIAIMSEFAEPSMITSHRLTEYGQTIIAEQAVETITQYF